MDGVMLKRAVRLFVIHSGVYALIMFAVIYAFFFALGAGVGVLAPIGTIIAVWQIKSNPCPGPFGDRSRKGFKGVLFGYPPADAGLGEAERSLLLRFNEESKKLWRINAPILVLTVGLLILSYRVSGFLVPIGTDPVDIGGHYVTPWAVVVARDLLIVALPFLMFFASGSFSGFVFGLSILRRWNSNRGPKRF